MDTAAFSNVVLADLIGGWELILILSVVLILFGAKQLPDLARGLEGDLGEFKKAVQGILDELGRSKDFHQPNYSGRPKENAVISVSFLLLIAQGFGVGRIAFAPGTFGSLVGLLWFFALLATRSFWLYLFYTILGIGLSIWVCGTAEKILKQTDPSSVVLDEIVAMPVCFAGWVAILFLQNDRMPTPEFFVSRPVLPLTLFVFAAFRFFDILKPWPVRQSQRLHGGWGVTIDDLLAAVYVNLVFLAVYGANALLYSKR